MNLANDRLARCASSCLAVWLLLTGCHGAGERVDPAADIRAGSGVAQPIELLVEAEPLDVSDDPSHDVLTLTRATERALLHSPELQAALARVRSSQADADQARLIANPILSVAVRFPTDGGGGDPVIEAGLAADLIAILQQPRRVDAADARFRAASAEALSAALDLLTEVQTSYTAAQALDAELNVLGERRKLLARLLTLARSRVELGESPQLDVLTLNSQRLLLDVEFMEKSSERRQCRLGLARLIGQPSGAADWALPPLQESHPLPIDQAAWITLAMHQRPEVQVRRWELSALRADADVAGWGALEGGDVGIDAERDGDWTVGPAVSTPLPIFDWGQARRQKAQAQVIEARHKLLQAQRLVVQEVRQAIESLTASQAALSTVRDELMPLQQQRIDHVEAAYRNGLADATAVLVAEQESQEARQKQIELQRKSAEALYRLHRAVGGPGAARSLSPTTKPTTDESTPHRQGQTP